jgi:hypothetical protein
MANTESSAVIRFINQVRSQPLFDAEAAQPMVPVSPPSPPPVPSRLPPPVPSRVAASPPAEPARRDSSTVMVSQVADRRARLPWAMAGAAVLGVAVAIGAAVALTGGRSLPTDGSEVVEVRAPTPAAAADDGAEAPAAPAALIAAGDRAAQTDETERTNEPAALARGEQPAAADQTAALLAAGAVDQAATQPPSPAASDDAVYTAGFDIRVQPAGAVVVLDGNELGAAPLRVGRLAPGAHTVELRAPVGYRSKTLEVELEADERAELEVELAASAVAARFDSEPRGATVTLIADGTPRILGSSPVTTELDPAGSYQVVFSMDGYPVQTRAVTVEAGTGVEVLAVMRDTAASRPAAAKREPTPARPVAKRGEAAAAPRAKPAAVKAPARPVGVTAAAAVKAPARPIAATAPARAVSNEADEPAADTGVLMIGAKPPCQIYIDGRDTGLTTPQRSIALAPGKHKVTLVNREFKIQETFTVGIAAGKTTRLIKELSAAL